MVILQFLTLISHCLPNVYFDGLTFNTMMIMEKGKVN